MRIRLWWIVPAAVQLVLAGCLCFVPLFDLLGYEFALATGIVAVATSLAIGLGAGRHRTALSAVRSALPLSLLHLVAPLLLSTLNMLRVRNCDYWEGLGFFVLLPVPTAAYGACLGALVGAGLSGARRWQRVGLAVAIAGLPLGLTLWHLYWQPPIFAYDHLWGHFAGSLYDENVGLSSSLALFRLGTLLRVGVVVMLALLWDRRAHLSKPRAVVLAVGVLLTAAAYDRIVGPRAGFAVSRAQIESALPLRVERPRLVLHLPADTDEETASALADEHSYRLEQLQADLELVVPRTIHSYVYPNADAKARLMGGRATMIAKPWLGEIHVHGVQSPHPIVAHELVHVVAASFGSRLLGVSAQWGLGVNLTLVEGLAEALSPERGALDLDGWTRGMRALKIAPDIRRMLGPAGFWAQAPNRAYTAAGSFVRYLLDTYGAEPLKQAYPSADFRLAYDKSLAELVTEWEVQLDAQPLIDQEQRIARERFRRPSIFARPCAHEVAQLRKRAGRAPPSEAVALRRTICEHTGNRPSARIELAMELLRAQQHDEFLEIVAELLADDRLTTTQRTRLLQSRADLAWKRGDLQRSRQDTAAAFELGANPDSLRLNWVKRWALELALPQREQLREFLSGELAPLGAVLRMQAARTAAPRDATLPYLIARQLIRVEAWQQGLELLESAPRHGFAPIAAEQDRLRAVALWRLDRLDEAAEAFRRYAGTAPTSGERARALDFAAQLAWRHRRR